MVLRRWYDPDQLWFPFMQGAIFLIRDEAEVKREHRPVPPAKLERKTYARMDPGAQHPYVYEKDVPQYVLPFTEFKRLSNKHFKRINLADFPTWERDEHGEPFRVWILERPYDPIEWCTENFDGRFHCSRQLITCEKEIDALRAKLVFS